MFLCSAVLYLDVEDMTLKTGNFKKFSMFLKMFSTALSKHSDTVFIDLLTFNDLQALKERKMKKNGINNMQAANREASIANNKRYIILTYVAEFDKYERRETKAYNNHSIGMCRAIHSRHDGLG